MFDQATYWRKRGDGYADEFTRNTPAIDALYARQEDEVAAVLDSLDLSHVHSVIEVGCGFGRVTPMLLDALPADVRYLGVDINAEQARRAEAATRLSYKVGDFLTLDLPPVDLVFACELFLHFPPEQIRAVLARAHRLAPLVVHVDPYRPKGQWKASLQRLARHLPRWDWVHKYPRLHPHGSEVQAHKILEGRQHVFVTRGARSTQP